MAEALPSSNFISMIKVDGVPIPVPPVISAEDRKNIEEWRRQALAVEERLYSRRQQHFTSSLQKSRLQSSKIGAIPARSANFEERPQSVSSEQVVRRALTSAAYNDEKAHMLAGMLQKVDLDDRSEHENIGDASVDENGQPMASGSVNSGPPIPSASSTDLEPYLSQSSTSSDESAGTVRPETISAEASEDRHQEQQIVISTTRVSYTIENPSSALLNFKQGESSPSKDASKPQFGHLGSMVARYLTEQQRAKNLSEARDLAKIQYTLQGPSNQSAAAPSVENSPSKRVQINAENQTESPVVAGVKRRRAGESKQTVISASDRLVALARGYLVRRVLQTQKLQHWIQTIRDCQRLLVPDTPAGTVDWRALQDSRFKEQVSSQLESALLQFHEIMFDWSMADRLALIAKDNAPRGVTPRSAHGRNVVKARVSPAASSVASRGRSLSTPSIQQHHHLQPKQPIQAVADVSKRRRIGATTPPKVGPSNQPIAQLHKAVNRPPTIPINTNRPATSTGTSGTRSPGAVQARIASGAISPRGQIGVTVTVRPNTAAPMVPSVPDTRSRRVAAAEASQPTAQTASATGRRATITGPSGSIRR